MALKKLWISIVHVARFQSLYMLSLICIISAHTHTSFTVWHPCALTRVQCAQCTRCTCTGQPDSHSLANICRLVQCAHMHPFLRAYLIPYTRTTQHTPYKTHTPCKKKHTQHTHHAKHTHTTHTHTPCTTHTTHTTHTPFKKTQCTHNTHTHNTHTMHSTHNTHHAKKHTMHTTHTHTHHAQYTQCTQHTHTHTMHNTHTCHAHKHPFIHSRLKHTDLWTACCIWFHTQSVNLGSEPESTHPTPSSDDPFSEVQRGERLPLSHQLSLVQVKKKGKSLYRSMVKKAAALWGVLMRVNFVFSIVAMMVIIPSRGMCGCYGISVLAMV